MFWWGQGAVSRAQDWGQLTQHVLGPQQLVMHTRGNVADACPLKKTLENYKHGR